LGGGKLGEKDFKDIMKIASDEKAIEYVVEGATLECSKGITSSKLATPGRKRICIGNRLQANIKDSKPNKNIMPFGKCRRGKKKPCTPKISMQWIGGKSDVIVDGAPALLATSKLVCQFGGTICIKDSGQSVNKCVDKKSNGALFMFGASALAPRAILLNAPVSIPALIATAALSKICAIESSILTAGTGSDEEVKHMNGRHIANDNKVFNTAMMIITNISIVGENALAKNPRFISPSASGKSTTAAIRLTDGKDNMVMQLKAAEIGATRNSSSGNNSNIFGKWELATTVVITYNGEDEEDIRTYSARNSD
jgi:hypothetical protein